MVYDMAMILNRRLRAITLLLAASSGPVLAAKPPKLPDSTPYCALPGAHPLFVSPMGEPFRAPPGAPYPSAAWMAQADSNRDGAVDAGEFVADARRFFKTIDLDHDGRIVPEEVIAYEREVAPEIALYGGHGLRPGDSVETERDQRRSGGNVISDLLGTGPESGSNYGGPMGAGRYAWLNIPEPVSSADADIDRVVSLDEFLAAAKRRYDTLAQGRGPLRLADLAKTPAQMALEGPCRPRPKPRKSKDDRRDDGRALDQESPR